MMAERSVTMPGGGIAVSAVLLTTMVAGTQRSSRNSSRRRARRKGDERKGRCVSMVATRYSRLCGQSKRERRAAQPKSAARGLSLLGRQRQPLLRVCPFAGPPLQDFAEQQRGDAEQREGEDERQRKHISRRVKAAQFRAGID